MGDSLKLERASCPNTRFPLDCRALNYDDSSTWTSLEELKERPPEIARVRHAERSDIRRIAGLARCRTLDTFSEDVHPEVVFEMSCLSILQENVADEIVSAIFLCNFPNIPALPPVEWPNWIHKLYDVESAKVTAMNTLFVHFLVWDDRYESEWLPELLTAAFYTVPYCTHIVLVQPPGVTPANVISEVMTRVPPKNEDELVEAQLLYVGYVKDFVPHMIFRLAVEEDNDDVVQILDTDCELLQQFYGEFYLSEMMRHPFASRSVVVSEKENLVSAVMYLNRSLDLDLLNDNFDLTAFTGLRKLEPEVGASESKEGIGSDIGIDILDEHGEELEYEESFSDAKSSVERAPIPDAFTLELLGFRDRVDELRSQELLRAGFECITDLDYCVTLVPTSIPYFPFLDLFTTVSLKPDKDFPMALYVTHRAIFQSELLARKALPCDYQALVQLLQGVTDAESIVQTFRDVLSKDGAARDDWFFILTCDDVIVGLATGCAENEVERLRRGYRLGDLAPRIINAGVEQRLEAGRLKRLVIMPIFSVRLGTFLAEVMRLAGLNILFHRTHLEPKFADDDFEPTEISPCLSVMQAVKPRIRNWPQFQYFFKKKVSGAPFDDLFSLFVLTPRLTMITKEVVNTKIVVVGASDCGLSFLDSLALGFNFRNLQFRDITLINMNGIRYRHASDYYVKLMGPFRARYCHAYRQLTPGRANYNSIKGTVVGIDREKRRVHIEDCGSISYDYLILTCGMLYERPELNSDPPNEEDHFDLIVPANCYLINDDLDASVCLSEIQRITEGYTKQKSIVFHGWNLDCYCALGAFLEAGIRGSWITLIQTNHSAQDDAFKSNNEIMKAVKKNLKSLGVTIMTNCELADWTFTDNENTIESLIIDTESGQQTIFCDALISYANKRPCLKTFLAISRAGLVFDGRLVIDSEFRTNDPRVFAAGTLTKYSRKLRCVAVLGLENAHYNSLEVGEKLAKHFVEMVMLNTKDNYTDEGHPADLPKTQFEESTPDLSYRIPIVAACLLPGGYRYIHVQKPGIRAAPESAEDAQDFKIQNMISLSGKHEALLNGLRARFSKNKIPDLFEYFREPWAAALFTDDFDYFRREFQERSSGVDLRETIKQQVSEKTWENGDDPISGVDRDRIVERCLKKSSYLKEVREGVIDYVARREDELPMYKTERRETQIRGEIADSPLALGLHRANKSSHREPSAKSSSRKGTREKRY